MNKQEIFDTVYEKLLKQGKASTFDGKCRYRGANGNKCAIGHLIPDELYESYMEGVGFVYLPENIIDYIVGDNKDSNIIIFMYYLQKAHDNILTLYGIKEWKEEMKEIANVFNLAFPE